MAGNSLRIAGSNYTQYYPNRNRQQLCADNKQERCWQPFQDQVSYRNVVIKGVTQVQYSNFGQILKELLPDWQIQSIIFADSIHHFLISSTCIDGDSVGNISWSKMHQKKVENQDYEQ